MLEQLSKGTPRKQVGAGEYAHYVPDRVAQIGQLAAAIGWSAHSRPIPPRGNEDASGRRRPARTFIQACAPRAIRRRRTINVQSTSPASTVTPPNQSVRDAILNATASLDPSFQVGGTADSPRYRPPGYGTGGPRLNANRDRIQPTRRSQGMVRLLKATALTSPTTAMSTPLKSLQMKMA